MKNTFVSLGLLVLSLTCALQTAAGQDQPALPEIDRTRLAEAFRLADKIGDQVWPGWSKAPFAVLLVTADTEFLLRHPQPSADFTKLGYDPLLMTDVYARKRSFPTSFLATFPAVPGNMTSTIVVGQAEHTWVKTSTPWVVTLLHEHFHQLQDSQPNFYPDVNALNLSRGDQTGMWMLNYAFPYDRQEVQQQFASMSQALDAAIKAPNSERKQRVGDYLDSQQKFRSLVSADDYRYLAFQFWKEGIARYTEYQVALLAAQKFKPSKEFQALKDYQSYAEVAESTRAGIFRQLSSQKLGEKKREVVYSFGAAEGLLLDQIRPGWRGQYFVEKFALDKLFR